MAGVVLLFFFSNQFIANLTMKAWEVPATPYRKMRPHKLGIVLTGTTIPLLEPDDRVYFQRGADRVVHTVQLYHLGLIDKILVSGGSGRIVGESKREADLLKQVMVMMHIPADSIIIENDSRNTHESAVAVAPMLDSLGIAANDCLLITSAFHVRRSRACFRKVGLDLEAFSTDFYSQPLYFTPEVLFVPSVEALLIWHKLTKEWVGLLGYKLAGYV